MSTALFFVFKSIFQTGLLWEDEVGYDRYETSVQIQIYYFEDFYYGC